MKFPLSDNTFPTLKLSKADEKELTEVANTVVKTAVDEYHDLVTRLNGVVDERRWKLLRQHEDVRVYREHHNNCRSRFAHSEETKAVVAPMLAFGSIDGSLDDVVYGIMCPSTAEMQLKSLYVEDGLWDWAVLTPIVAPSEHEPLREFSIKWALKGNPAVLRPIMRLRDMVYIDSIGVTETPGGETVAYYLWHSVEVPEIRELTDCAIVRANVSFCCLMRQRNVNSTEVFTFGVVSPMGTVPPRLIAFSAAETLVSIWKNAYCAEMKKLTRLLSAARPHQSSISSSASESLQVDSAGSGNETANARACVQCMTVPSLVTSRLSGSTRLKACALCSARVCAHCRAIKHVGFPSPHAHEKKMTTAAKVLCTRCLRRVVNTSSAVFAALDARAARGEAVDYFAALVDGPE